MDGIISTIISMIMAVITFFAGIISSGGFGSPDYTAYKDLSYGANERNVLDLYVPEEVATEKAAGLVLFIYGDDWVSGDKSYYDKVCEEYADDGYITASMNYRYVDAEAGVDFFDQLDDINAAVEFLKDKTAELGLDVSRAAIEGTSSGAHLAMLYAYSCNSPLDIVFVGNRAGAADFHYTSWWYTSASDEEYTKALSAYSGRKVSAATPSATLERIISSVSPASYVTKTTPPTICAYGALDNIVMAANSQCLIDAFDAAEAQYKYIYFKNSGHTLNHDPLRTREYNKTFETYLENYLEIKG